MSRATHNPDPPPRREATPTPALARSRSGDDALLGTLILLLGVTLFIPHEVSLQLGAITLTPSFAVSIVLFPLLLAFGRIRWAWPELVVLLLFACWFISTARSSPLERTVESIGRLFLAAFVPYLVGRYLMRDTRLVTKFLGLVIGLTAALALAAVLESTRQINIHSVLWSVPYHPHPEMRLGLTRAHAWTSHAIMYGLVNAMFIPIVMVAAIQKLRVAGPWPVLKGLALATGCFLSLSTGAWGPAMLSVILVGWDYLCKVRPHLRWRVIFITSVAGYFVLEAASGRPLLRILMMQIHLTSPDAWYYRWMLYERVYAAMPGYWWFGHGLDVPMAFQNFGSSIDNNFLVVLLFYGRVGLTAWIAVIAAVIFYGGKAVWGAYDTSYVRFTRAIMFGLVGITFTQLSVALFSTPAVLYWLMLGMAVGGTQNCQREMKQLDAARRAKRLASRQNQARRLNHARTVPAT